LAVPLYKLYIDRSAYHTYVDRSNESSNGPRNQRAKGIPIYSPCTSDIFELSSNDHLQPVAAH